MKEFLAALPILTTLLFSGSFSHAQELNEIEPTTRKLDTAAGETKPEAELTPAQKLNRQAIEAMGTKKWKEVFTLLSQAMKEDPAEVQTYLNFGVVHYMREEYPSCEGALRKALAVDPESDKAHYLFSKVIVLKGERELAVSSAKKAFELSEPKEWTYMAWLAELHEGSENYTSAADCYSETLSLLKEKLNTVKTGISQVQAREIITDTWEETDIFFDTGSGRMEELTVQKYRTEQGKAPVAWIKMKEKLELQILEITAKRDEALKLTNG